MKKIIVILSFGLLGFTSFAQTKDDINNRKTSIVWLGVDCSHLKFIVDANQWTCFGAITSQQLIDKYFPGWNQLFINEAKRYNIAKLFIVEK